MSSEASARTVTLEVAGRSYRVSTTASDKELTRLVRVVEQRVKTVGGSRGGSADAILLAALWLAHDVEEERARADRVVAKAKAAATELLDRVDRVLTGDLGNDEGRP